jgi:TPR repeat protein
VYADREDSPLKLSEQERNERAQKKYEEALQVDAVNFQEKLDLYREAADFGHGKARINVAKVLQRNPDEESQLDSFRYYTLAAVENRHPAAIFQVGHTYQNDLYEHVKIDAHMALMFFVEGTLLGNVNCAFGAGTVSILHTPCLCMIDSSIGGQGQR